MLGLQSMLTQTYEVFIIPCAGRELAKYFLFFILSLIEHNRLSHLETIYTIKHNTINEYYEQV